MPLHSSLEHVTLRAIEVRDFARVCEEAVAPPCAQEGDDDRLGEGRRLQVRNGRLGGEEGRHKTTDQFKPGAVLAYVFVNGIE